MSKVDLTDLTYKCVVKSAFSPALFEDDTTGPVIDMNGGIETVYAILSLSTMSLGWEVSLTFQENDVDSGGTWQTIQEASFTSITNEGVHIKSFARSKRYLRCLLERAGSPTLSVLVLQAKE